MPYNWLQFNGDAQHSGNNTSETILSAANVASLKLAFQVTLPAVADGAPVVLTGVTTPLGTRDLLFLTTKAGHILALDAHTGATIWSHQYGPGTCQVNLSGGPCFTTSSPAIDPSLAHVYSYGLDGKVHQYAVGSGTETTTGGWPELVTNKPYNDKESSALSVATAASGTTYLYVTTGGYPGDQGNYQGHLTAISLKDGSQQVFNAVCSNQAVHFVQSPGTPDCAQLQAAIWGRGPVVYHPALDKIFMATGNGTFNPSNFFWGDTLLSLHPDGTSAGGMPLDSFTPTAPPSNPQTNYPLYLQQNDKDLGSTAPAILPVPPSSNVAHLALQSGKDGILRLVNLDNLSGQGGPGHTGGSLGTDSQVLGGTEVTTTPAVWVNPADGSTWAFVANGSGTVGLKLVVTGGTPSLTTGWPASSVAGSSPLVANGVLYVAEGGRIRALAPATGAQLWQDFGIGGIHWESPVVANGTLYITDENGALTAYSANAPPPVPALSAAGPTLLAAALCVLGLRHIGVSRRSRRDCESRIRCGA